MDYVDLREANIQVGMAKMESDMSQILKVVTSKIGNVRKETTSQVAKSRLLSAELKNARRQHQ